MPPGAHVKIDIRLYVKGATYFHDECRAWYLTGLLDLRIKFVSFQNRLNQMNEWINKRKEPSISSKKKRNAAFALRRCLIYFFKKTVFPEKIMNIFLHKFREFSSIDLILNIGKFSRKPFMTLKNWWFVGGNFSTFECTTL